MEITMGQLATTVEQSQHLLDLGLSADTADMVILHEEPYETSDSKFDGLHKILPVPFKEYDKQWKQKYKNISYFPAWSLGALLEVLPDEIRTHKGRFDAKYRFYWELRKNWILYSCLDEDYSPLIEFDGKNNLEAVFNMVVWLLENGYIKKEV